MGIKQSIPTAEEMQGMEMGLASVWGESKGAFLMPYMLGGVANFVQFGAVLAMFFQWLSWVRIHGDRRFISVMVLISVATSIASVIYILCWVNAVFVWNFGTYKTFGEARCNSATVTSILPSDPAGPSGFAMIDKVMTLSVQIFYVGRAYKLNKRKFWILPFIVPGMLVSTGGAIGMYIQMWMHPWGGESPAQASNILLTFYLWSFGSLSADLGITLTMAYGLHANKTGWKNLDRTLSTLILLSLETQIPALCSAIALAVTYTQKDKTTAGIFFLMAHTHIYIIGLLAMLNHRSFLRNQLSGAEQYFTDSRQCLDNGRSIPHRNGSEDTGVTDGPHQSTNKLEGSEKVMDVERLGAAF